MIQETVSEVSGSSVRNDDLMGKSVIPVIVSRQGSRIAYQMNLMFRQITNLIDHTLPKPSKSKDSVEEIDVRELRNRYLRADKASELAKYVADNLDSYILPPISAVTEALFSFEPYNHKEIIEKMGEEYDLVKKPHLTEAVLEAFDGMLQGLLIIKESEFNVEIMDGNHRVAAIHQLTTMGKDYKNLRIGVQIFHENSIDRQRQAFVDMNTSTPIDKTILTLFSNRDALSIAAKETIGTNVEFAFEEFTKGSDRYIGFDAINDSVTRNSAAVLSLNMVKNMLVRFALGDSGTPKKFTSTFDVKSREYDALLRDFAIFFKTVFRNHTPFIEIQNKGTSSIPKLREQYISLTGAGLYVMANIGHLARTKHKDMAQVALELSRLDWRREVPSVDGTQPNVLFRSGILSENGSISNNRSATIATLEALAKELYL